MRSLIMRSLIMRSLIMRSLILSLLVLQLLLPGAYSEGDDRKPKKPLMCKNPKAKEGQSTWQGCSTSTCKKIGQQALWQPCPKVGLEKTVKENDENLERNHEMSLEILKILGNCCPTTPTWDPAPTTLNIAGWTDQDLEHIIGTVQSFMTEHNVVGSSLALVKDGRLVYAKGFGVMDKDTREPVQSTSLFRIAGLSKPITSAAIMMLSERIPGLMERTVFGSGGILGTTYGTLPYSEYETQISIKHLLEHTAGGEAWRNSDPMLQHLTYDHDELVGWVLDTRDPSKKPGTEYAYSNFGYTVLGRVIEKLSGKSYESFVRDNILNPIGALGMKIGKSKKSERYPNEVTYHSSGSAYYPDLNIERMDADGGWISSPADYARFLMHFDGSNTTQDLISRSTYDLMTEGSSVNTYYAKGWLVNPRHDNIWNSGGLPGTRAYAMNVAKRQWGSFETSAVFIMNSENVDGYKIDRLLWKIQLGITNWP